MNARFGIALSLLVGCAAPEPVQPQVCDANTCATGCCQDGQCVAGTKFDACGTGGAACVDCGDPDYAECMPTQACGSVTVTASVTSWYPAQVGGGSCFKGKAYCESPVLLQRTQKTEVEARSWPPQVAYYQSLGCNVNGYAVDCPISLCTSKAVSVTCSEDEDECSDSKCSTAECLAVPRPYF